MGILDSRQLPAPIPISSGQQRLRSCGWGVAAALREERRSGAPRTPSSLSSKCLSPSSAIRSWALRKRHMRCNSGRHRRAPSRTLSAGTGTATAGRGRRTVPAPALPQCDPDSVSIRVPRSWSDRLPIHTKLVMGPEWDSMVDRSEAAVSTGERAPCLMHGHVCEGRHDTSRGLHSPMRTFRAPTTWPNRSASSLAVWGGTGLARRAGRRDWSLEVLPRNPGAIVELKRSAVRVAAADDI